MPFNFLMQKKHLILIIIAVICATAPFIFIKWPLLFFFWVPTLYLLFVDSHHNILKWYHYCIPAVIGSAVVLFPVIFFRPWAYFVGVLLSSFFLSCFFLILRFSVRLFAGRKGIIFIPVVIWINLCYLLDFQQLMQAGFDVGIQLPFTAPLIWYVGSIGITLLLILFNSALAYLVFKKDRFSLSIIIIVAIIFISCFIYSHTKDPRTLSKTKKPLKVALIQANFPKPWKWFQENPYTVLERYETLSLKAAKEKPDLIIWPEYSIPIDFLNYTPKIKKTIIEIIQKSNTNFLIGSIIYDQETKLHEDCALFFNQQGELVDYYSSVTPSPFSYYTARNKKPLKPIGDFGVFVCWEEINKSLARNLADLGAKYFFSISNDQNLDNTWLHTFAALYSRARAAENKRYVARAANTGITQIISPLGRILKLLPINASNKLIGVIYPIEDKTFYTKYGDLLTKIALLLIIVGLAISKFIKR